MQASASLQRKSSGLLLVLLLVGILALVQAGFGQAYFGTVSGELTDASGAVVSGAKVVLADQQKGFKFEATSDNSGHYLFRAVPPGLYSVSAESKGFSTTVQENFKVDVNQNATVNLTMKVAGAAEKVEVTAGALTIQTEDAETGQVVNRRFINDLPLIDRDVVALTSLAPGVTAMDDQCNEFSGNGTCTGTNFVSNGSRGSTSDILADGVSVTNSEPNGGITSATYVPSPEAVEEFKVQQTNFSAEYGFSGASVVNMVTRSGSNSFHGSAYEFFRDNVLDAKNWFDHRAGAPMPAQRRNNYGFTFGGPILKNKTFFFFDFDGLRNKKATNASAGVPSDAMRAGNFGEVCTTQGGTFDSSGLCSVAAGQIWDPYSGMFDSTAGGIVRTTFIPFNNIATYVSPGNPTLPANLQPAPGVHGNLIDPVAQKMMDLFPQPNFSGPNGIYENWFGAGANHGTNRQFDIKIDHRFTEKNLVSGKFSYQYSSHTSFDCFKNFVDPCAPAPSWSNAHLFAINDTHTFSPSLLLNVTLGFTRGVWHNLNYNSHGVSDPLGQLGFPSYLNSNGFTGVPAIFIDMYTPAGFPNLGGDPFQNMLLGQDTGQLSAILDKLHGRHEIKFGFDGRIHQINYIQTNSPNGFFDFATDGSSACPGAVEDCGGDAMASFLMGQLTQSEASNGWGSFYELQSRPATTNYQYGFFVQDNWKTTPKLTLNLGLRYDVTLPRTERFNRQNWFDPNVTSPLNGGSISYNDPVTGALVNVPLKGGEVFASSNNRTTYATDWHDFQPRVGFAYQFAPKMVARGGYGIYYGQSRSGVTGVMYYGSQGFNQYTNVITTYQSLGNTPWLHLNDPFPNGLIQPAGNSLGLMNDVGFGANGPLRTTAGNRTPNEQSWSFGLERELPSNIVVNAQYIGKKGTHLPFTGSSQRNHLGAWVESLPVGDPDAVNPCQALSIACLNSYVPNPFAGIITDPNSGLSSSEIQYYQLLLPYPQFTGVENEPQLAANSVYHALQLVAEKRYSNGLQFLVSYTWSKSIDDSSNADQNITWLGSFDSLQNPNKPWLERSLSTFDIPHVIQFSYSYDLPFGRGRQFLGSMPGWANAIIGGWKTNGIWRISDGRPLSFTVDNPNALIPTYGSGGWQLRPNIVGTPKRNSGSDWVDNYFADNSVFQIPADYTLGNAPRTLGRVRSPWQFTSDLSVGKQFPIREQMNLEFRVEARNAFNHPVFAAPNTTVDDPSFGTINDLSIGPRELQLGLKFNF
jgi:Carboxypeptidase regulatory-like domain/TonB dependent receptor/TonB-dependent Receptor Plug Domain